VVPELVEWGHLDDGAEELLGELVHLVDSLPARALAAHVLGFEQQETEPRLLHQIRDALARLQQTLPRVDDGLRERSDVTSGFVTLRGRKQKKKFNVLWNKAGEWMKNLPFVVFVGACERVVVVPDRQAVSGLVG